MRALAATTRRRLLDEAIVDLIRTRRLLEGSLALIADSLAGQPQAARYDGHVDQVARLWCFTHERDHRACQFDGLGCGGTPVNNSDPTGDAATSPDPAAEALRTIDAAIIGAANAARSVGTEVSAWSPASTDMQHPDPHPASPPEGCCTSCWRDNGNETEIGIRPGGTAPYYTGLCEWCGDFLAAEGYLPPVAVLKIRHGPRKVSQRDIARHRPPGHR